MDIPVLQDVLSDILLVQDIKEEIPPGPTLLAQVALQVTLYLEIERLGSEGMSLVSDRCFHIIHT